MSSYVDTRSPARDFIAPGPPPARVGDRQRIWRTWRRRSGWAREAIASRCWSAFRRPAAAPTCTGKTASPSTPARRSLPRRFCSRNCGAFAVGALSDDVELRACDPFYRIRFHDGQTFTYSGDSEEMRAEVAKFDPGDVEGYSRFMHKSEEICRIGFEQLGHEPFDSLARHGQDRAATCCACKGYRSVYGLVSQIPEERTAAHHLQLSSAADRRQSVSSQRNLLPDRASRKALGRPLCDGRHGQVGRADWST